MVGNKLEKKYAIIYIIIVYVLIFQNFLQKYVSIFQYTDEMIALIGILYYIGNLIKNKKIKKSDIIIIISLILLTIIGFYSNFTYKYQDIGSAAKDWFLVMKFFFVYLSAKTISSKIDIKINRKLIYNSMKIIVIILSIFTILNYIFKLYPSEVRYGIMSNKLFYEHPTYLAAVCIALIANIILFSNKIINKYIIICLILLITTLRSKAIAASIVIILLVSYINIRNKKISLIKLMIVGIIAIMVAWSQIEYYFIDIEGSPRRVLMETSVTIANDYCPIGTGFGTYGSYTSGENYSPVYEIYGINKVDGIMRGRAYYLSDTFWPMIMGQFGFLGTAIYIVCLTMIFINIQKSYENGKNIYISKIIALVYLVISSVAEATFVNPISIPLALILGLELNQSNNNMNN